MRLLQVCNVGDICGGTAACAWSITRALPDWEHVVFFLSRPTAETRLAFSNCEVRSLKKVSDLDVHRTGADVALLHNSSVRKVERIGSTFSIQYCHSTGDHVAADAKIACSDWLSRRLHNRPAVLHQPVLIPPRAEESQSRSLDEEVIVGRICTPRDQKWTLDSLPVYRAVTQAFPELRWEFVGCPPGLQQQWSRACEHRVSFHPAGWRARSHLWGWHAMLYHNPGVTETFGRTVSEALRAGCVPIVDARGGFGEQLEDSPAGSLCGTVDEFVDAVLAIRDSSTWWKQSRAARQFSEERWSLSAFRKRFLKLLRDVSRMDSATEA